jgi:hypothetical protein
MELIKNGYSKPFVMPFKDAFQVQDDFNKWTAKFPNKDIRLFISGGLLQFSNDYWIETDYLIKGNWMYLLCKNSKGNLIKDWLKDDCAQFSDE